MNFVADEGNAVTQFIIANQLVPEAASCLLRCNPEIQEKVVGRGPCDPTKVRDQVAVIKKRIQHANSGGVASGIHCREVEAFIASRTFDERAKDVLRTAASQVQRVVLDRGPCTDVQNPSAVLLVRVREAQRGVVFMDGRHNNKQLPGSAYEGGKKRSALALESESGVPVVTWLSFGANSHFVQAGFAGEGPAILYNKRDDILSQAQDILDKAGCCKVEVEHDEKWEKFPGIGEAFKKDTGEENVFAIATSSEHGKWAAGFHYGRKGRELAAKLALAVAIVSGSDLENRVGQLFPDFAIILDEAAIGAEVARKKSPISGGSVMPIMDRDAGLTGTAVMQAAEEVQARLGGRASKWDMPAHPPPMKEAQPMIAAKPMPMLPTRLVSTEPTRQIKMPDVTAIVVPANSKVVLQGYPTEAPTIVFDKVYQAEFFSQASGVLTNILGTAMKSEIHHDDDWKRYPEIGAALKPCGIEENCFAVAMCPNVGKWALGVGGSPKGREAAAQMALSVAVALDTPHFQATICKFPAFCQLCAKLGLVA